MIRRSRFGSGFGSLTIALALLVIATYFAVLSQRQSKQVKTLRGQLFDTQKKQTTSGLSTTTNLPALPEVKIDKSKTTTYDGKAFSLIYYSAWKLRENNRTGAEGVEIVSDESLFGTALVPANQGVIKVREAHMSWLKKPEDYLATMPYKTKNREFTVNGKKAIEVENKYQETVWLETLIVNNPQEPYLLISVTPGNSAQAVEAYKVILQSVKLKASKTN